jgi:CDP-diacylglycerol---serine O-phosphatidyltransferase
MKIKLFTIPNILTCGNLLCGCIGIVEVFHSNIILACWLMCAAAVFDFLDGFAARAFNAASPIGKELDSLADMVTFGVLPATILFSLIQDAVPDLGSLWKAYLAYIMAVFSALRLAKFNIDTRQSDSFIGVPTPANGLLVASLPLIIRYQPEYKDFIVNTNLLLGYVVLMSYLLVCELPLFALKFKKWAWEANKIQYIFIGMAIVLLFLLKFAAVPIIIACYVLLSVISFIRTKN